MSIALEGFRMAAFAARDDDPVLPTSKQIQAAWGRFRPLARAFQINFQDQDTRARLLSQLVGREVKGVSDLTVGEIQLILTAEDLGALLLEVYYG